VASGTSGKRKARGAGSPQLYRLTLFVAGDEPNSRQASEALARLCAGPLADRCEVRIVDVEADYQAALDHGVIMVPTLVVESPPPVRAIVGTLSDEAEVLAALGLAREGGQR